MAEHAAAPLFEEVEKPIDYKYYLFLFRKYLYVIITFFVIAVTLATIYAAKLPNQYRAASQLIIERPNVPWLGTGKGSDIEATTWTNEYYQTQMQIMRSPTVLRMVMEDLRLKDYFETDNEDAIVGRLRGMVFVNRIKGSRLFQVGATSSDPEFAADLSNGLARSYIRKNFEDSLYYRKEILAWLPQEEGAEDEVITIEDPFGDKKQMTRGELIESLPAIRTDATVRSLAEKKNTLEAELGTLLQRYREKHPLIIQARANLTFLADSIEAEKSRIIEGLKAKAVGEFELGRGRVVETARVPKAPFGPDRMRTILMVGGIELFLSLLIIFLFDYFDDTLHSLANKKMGAHLINRTPPDSNRQA